MDDLNVQTETLASLRQLRKSTDHELGAVIELIRDRCPRESATRLMELGLRLVREAQSVCFLVDDLE